MPKTSAPSGMAWDAYKALIGLNVYDKVLNLPPGTPDNIIKAYWDAAEKMLQDAEFKRVVAPLVGEKSSWYVSDIIARGYKQNMGLDPKVVTWLKDLMKTKYGIVVE